MLNLWKERFLLENTENSHWPFKHVDAVLKIHIISDQSLGWFHLGCWIGKPTCKSIPKSTMAHSIPSRMYSSCQITITITITSVVIVTCSKTNMWWLKNCWSFSLQKLIASCSNPLKSKISNPAMSRTPDTGRKSKSFVLKMFRHRWKKSSSLWGR